MELVLCDFFRQDCADAECVRVLSKHGYSKMTQGFYFLEKFWVL